MNRKPIAVLLAAAALAAPLATSPAAVANESGAVQDRYVAALVAAHSDASAYTQMDDYVRVLEYWHDHPDWAVGS